jgi:hypothetical protein
MNARETELLSTLQGENAALRSEVAYLKVKLRAAGLLPPDADLPNDDEVTKLLHIVGTHHHRLIPREMEEVAPHRERFKQALFYLQFCRKSDKPSPYSLASFCDACNEWLRRYDQIGDVGTRPFLAACAASDIRISSTANFPYDIDVGLVSGVMDRAYAGWRAVLARNAPAPLLESKRQFNLTFRI